MKPEIELIQMLEDLAVNAWPAHVQQTLGTWRLRANFGVSLRANSVYTAGPCPDHDDWACIVDDFCRSHGIPVRYYVSPSSPADLDEKLDDMGFRKALECLFMTASCTDVMSRVERDDRYPCRFAPMADDEWMDDFLRLEGYPPDHRHAYARIFSAIRPKKAFARICDNGETIAMGTVVVERGWACLSNIVVDPSRRGKGIGSQLLGSLAGWAVENGAGHLYLQVLQDNAPAVRLYEKLGFSALSRYHYRIR